MPNLDFYGWSQIETDAFYMYVPFIKISQWDDVNSTVSNSLFNNAIWNILHTQPTPTYFVSNLLLNINNGLNVAGARNNFRVSDNQNRVINERCGKNYSLMSPYSPGQYITNFAGDNECFGLWYGDIGNSSYFTNPYYYCLVETPAKTALFEIHDFSQNPSKAIGSVFNSWAGETWAYCRFVWDKATFDHDYPNIVIENPERNEKDKDPYSGDTTTGGTSTPDGGQGTSGKENYTPNSDNNPIPSLPSISVADTGFITLYNPSISELQSLANYLWGNLFDVSTWKKVMSDPMDAILGLSVVPVNVPSGAQYPVIVGNINTGISLTKATGQFVEVDCGTVTLTELWKAYLDYAPYTRVSIYLPYIGSQELDIDLIQNKSVGVKYHVDVLSGACVAFVTSGGNVIAQFSGQCGMSIPITSQDFTQTILSLCQLVASGVGVVATGGMSAPVQGMAIAGMATATANTANNVISSKPAYAKSGNMSGGNGFMGVQIPYLIIEQPRQCSPSKQNTFTGYPCYITYKLRDLRGFTQIQEIHLENMNATETEKKEILSLLHSGVIL